MKRRIWNRPVWIKLIATLADILFLLSMVCLILITFYLNGVLNTVVLPKLHDAVRRSTHGRYTMSNDTKIAYDHGKVVLHDVRIVQIGYQDSGMAIAVREVVADTIYLRGINWWNVAIGDGLQVTRMEMNSPQLYMREVDTAFIAEGGTTYTSSPLIRLLPNPSEISFDSIVITDMQVFFPHDHIDKLFLDSISVHMSDVILEEERIQPVLSFSYQSMNVIIPRMVFAFDDSAYTLAACKIRANITDSLLSIDSFSFKPRYAREQFAARQRYLRGMISFQSYGIRVQGVDFASLIERKRAGLKMCDVERWSVAYYSDKRKPRDPDPPAAKLPNDFFRTFPMALDIDTIRMPHGKITIIERAPGSLEPGSITFDRASILVSNLCSDTLSPDCGKPTRIVMSALFLAEAPVTVKVTYPVFRKKLDLRITASVGKLSGKKLNAFLIPNERKEITEGVIESGDLEMDIRDGTSMTIVTPRYRDLAMKVLPNSVRERRGIIEGLKTLIANTFVIKSENLDHDDEKAQSGISKRSRKKNEEFLQFIWLATRKSLDQVIGGIE